MKCTGTVSDIRVRVAGTADDGNAGKFAQLAKELHETGFTVVRNHLAKPKKEPVVGSSTSNEHVSSVTTTKVVDTLSAGCTLTLPVRMLRNVSRQLIKT